MQFRSSCKTEDVLKLTFFPSGAHHQPMAKVTCHDNHTVDIAITNVDDYREWNADEWQLQSNAACEPIIGDETVTYTNLHLPNCAMSWEQLPNDIKYVLKINAEKTAGQNDQGQTRAYNHLYYVSCDYDNQNRSSSSFVPIKNRDDNDSSMYHIYNNSVSISNRRMRMGPSKSKD